MKIILAVHGFPPNQIGGAEWRTHRTARWLKRRGHMVQVVAVDNTDYPGDGINVSIEHIDGIDVTRLSFNRSKVATWQYKNPLIGKYLTGRLHNDRPDIFHLISGVRNTGSAVQAARDTGVPVVVTLTEFYWICPRNTLLRNTGELCHCPDNELECLLCLRNTKLNKKLRYPTINRATSGLYGKLLLWASQYPFLRAKMVSSGDPRRISEWRSYLKAMLMQTARLIAPSQFLKDMYVASGIPEDLFVLCRQGLDTSQWKPPSLNEDHGPVRFGFVGNIYPHKGVDILIQAFKQLNFSHSQVRLNIFGEIDKHPVYGRRLHQLANSDKRIRFAGHFDNREIPSVFSQIDVLIVPSVWYENSPNVILEAYACKTPVIASDIGGMAELVQRDICGDLFKLRDVKGLRAILHRIAAQPSILAQWRMGIPNVKLIEEEISELEGIYSSVVSKNS